MKAYLQDYVRTSTHNHIGRVYAKYALFTETGATAEWFDLQHPPLDPDLKSGTWYSILTHGGGSVLVPEINIIEVCDIPIEGKFENTWTDFYFRNTEDFN